MIVIQSCNNWFQAFHSQWPHMFVSLFKKWGYAKGVGGGVAFLDAETALRFALYNDDGHRIDKCDRMVLGYQQCAISTEISVFLLDFSQIYRNRIFFHFRHKSTGICCTRLRNSQETVLAEQQSFKNVNFWPSKKKKRKKKEKKSLIPTWMIHLNVVGVAWALGNSIASLEVSKRTCAIPTHTCYCALWMDCLESSVSFTSDQSSPRRV